MAKSAGWGRLRLASMRYGSIRPRGVRREHLFRNLDRLPPFCFFAVFPFEMKGGPGRPRGR